MPPSRRASAGRCGKLFCPKCVGGPLQRRLNQNAELNTRGVLSPVCYECYVEENGWFSERGSAKPLGDILSELHASLDDRGQHS